MNEVFQLTRADIEAQVVEDLIRYKKLYFAKYHKSPSTTLDIDNFVQELWGVSVEFGQIANQIAGREVLGQLQPEFRRIIVDNTVRINQGSISFTVGHEAGHLSLHALMFKLEDGAVVDWVGAKTECQLEENKRKRELNDNRREWQADHYAAALLAPKIEIVNLLNQLGLVSHNTLINPVDLQVHGDVFASRFGLSRQALEIRLKELSIPIANAKYSALTNRKAA